LLAGLTDARVVAVDIPIGIPVEGIRPADVAARAFLAGRASAVFATPIRAVLEAPDYAAARLVGPSTSAQAYALRRKILEVDALAPTDERVYEAHPEVSFRALRKEGLPPKKTWNGLLVRRSVLASVGILLPDDLGPAGVVPADDVLDAAAAAWSAWRIGRGEAERLPPGAEDRIGSIWY
jgi:predicted RNase H-like nuclease